MHMALLVSIAGQCVSDGLCVVQMDRLRVGGSMGWKQQLLNNDINRIRGKLVLCLALHK
jgi:hypothetical protein